jgi:hypothetical protein
MVDASSVRHLLVPFVSIWSVECASQCREAKVGWGICWFGSSFVYKLLYHIRPWKCIDYCLTLKKYQCQIFILVSFGWQLIYQVLWPWHASKMKHDKPLGELNAYIPASNKKGWSFQWELVWICTIFHLKPIVLLVWYHIHAQLHHIQRSGRMDSPASGNSQPGSADRIGSPMTHELKLNTIVL